jgi:hypothetical protein
VLEVVFILLESLSPSRRIFIGSHSLPPLWFAVSVLHRASDVARGTTATGLARGAHTTELSTPNQRWAVAELQLAHELPHTHRSPPPYPLPLLARR